MKSFKELEKRKDKNVQILTDDLASLDKLPKIYAYIIVGVKYQSRWYLKKDMVTYFNEVNLEEGKKYYFNNLQKWSFFKGTSYEFNPEFWESNFFEKVPDLTKDPKWKKYGKTMWATEEENNRPYLGLYKIVAESMRKELQEKGDRFESEISEQILKPYYEKLKKNKPEEFTDYSIMYNKFTLIYPKDLTIVLNPIRITNSKGEKQIRYFVVFPDTKEVYEWIYLKPENSESASWHYGSEIIDQLSVVTKWNFSYDSLEDKKFWDNYILKKENGTYLYLKKIE
ncbi:MAG: hypothetical protein K2X86_17925 [Cytophagaceae bacterium]|nr:hypothetical protein [Cytophagaceae bacterium]